MLILGVLQTSTSPYSSAIVIVMKKNNTNMFCIDFRALNSQTVFDAEPMPNVEEMFPKLAGYKYFHGYICLRAIGSFRYQRLQNLNQVSKHQKVCLSLLECRLVLLQHQHRCRD